MISVGNSGNQSVAPITQAHHPLTPFWPLVLGCLAPAQKFFHSLSFLIKIMNQNYGKTTDMQCQKIWKQFPNISHFLSAEVWSESTRAFNGSCVPPSIHPFTTPSGCHDELQNHGVQLQIGLTGRFVAACYGSYASTTDKKQKGQHRNPSAECSIITVFFNINRDWSISGSVDTHTQFADHHCLNWFLLFVDYSPA